MDTEMMEHDLRVAQEKIAYLKKVLDRKPYRCDKCGEGSRRNHLFAPQTELFGGVSAHLCAKCITEWSAHLFEHEIWLRAETNYARLALLIGTDGADTKAAEFAQAQISISRDAFALAQQWMNGGL